MTRRTEKTVITVKTFQRTLVRLHQKQKIALCEQCAAVHRQRRLQGDDAVAVEFDQEEGDGA